MLKEKNNNTQIVRGILIVMVIFIHSIAECTVYENFFLIIVRTLCNVAVPTFIFISGYYFNMEKYKCNSKKYIFNKVRKILVPLFIWNIIYFILLENHSLNKLITFSSAGHLYFIIVLVQLILITPLILKYYNNIVFRTVCYLITPVYLVIYRILWIKYNFVIPFHQYYFFAWIIYYIEGIRYKNFKNNMIKFKNMSVSTIYILISIYNIFVYIFIGFEYALSQMCCMNLLFSMFIFRWVNYFIMSEKVNGKLFANIGNVSFGIYFVHILVLKILNFVFKFAEIHIYIIIIKAVLTLFISYFIIKYFNFVTKNKFKWILGF